MYIYVCIYTYIIYIYIKNTQKYYFFNLSFLDLISHPMNLFFKLSFRACHFFFNTHIC